MKSISIKTNDSNLKTYLLNEFQTIELDDICFSEKKFKHYHNIIIHYAGTDTDSFLAKIASILTLFVIDEQEEHILEKLMMQNYFYFDSTERKQILNICYDILAEDFSHLFDKKFKSLYHCFYDFLKDNKAITFSGFMNFRAKDYLDILDEILNEAVNSFIIEKEYLEFISLLKLYVNSQEQQSECAHIIYSSFESILLDEKKNIVHIDNDIFKAKYLSDISFSSNDYTLNSLLTLLPKKIYIHLIDNYIDEFINTLQLVFENKVTLCTDCDICNMYKQSSVYEQSKSRNK